MLGDFQGLLLYNSRLILIVAERGADVSVIVFLNESLVNFWVNVVLCLSKTQYISKI